jgi:hypothetical protein
MSEVGLGYNQPNRYQFPVKLEVGQYFKKNADETVSIMNKLDQPTSTILKPWARDKNGKSLQTYFEVEPTFLNQFINFENAEFPITADPLWCGEVASYVGWNWRTYYNSGAWSLTIKPTWCGINMSGPTPWASWQEIYNKAPYHEAWAYPQAYGTSLYWSMYNQYVCHTDWKAFAYLADRKNPWNGSLEYNLEPWRWDKGYWGFYNSQCN